MARRLLHDPILWIALAFIMSLFGMGALRPLFAWAYPGIDPVIYGRTTFPTLWLSHAGLVFASSLASTLAGVGLALFVTRGRGREFRAIVDSVAAIGQTFPPVTVLAITVPIVGFGVTPTLIALTLYGFMPILENAIAGFAGVPADIQEAAIGSGLSPWQRFRQVELPLAAPLILNGIRISVIVNIGTATVGSTVGALTLGTPIISGLVSEKVPFVIEGVIVVGLFAMLTDRIFDRLAAILRRRQEG